MYMLDFGTYHFLILYFWLNSVSNLLLLSSIYIYIYIYILYYLTVLLFAGSLELFALFLLMLESRTHQ